MSARRVEILLPNHLPHGFDYAVPEGMQLTAGDYVFVPFGSRELPGVVWGEGTGAVEKLKPVRAHLAHLPKMQEPMRTFLDWASWYTLSPKGAVLKMALPMAEALQEPNTRERGLRIATSGVPAEVHLSADQQAAAAQLRESLPKGFSVTLLDGVTGSGKTEVYFDAIEAVMQQGGQALVLLPEIALSVQWLSRFEKRFGFQPYVWHSGLPLGRRKHTWRAIVNGEARVVVGARSALFLPFKNLRLLVADEEHDTSYKQEDGVIYHARDMAVARAQFEKIPVLLVSATPSLETLANVQAGKYRELKLHARHGGAQFPEVQMVDMRSASIERGAFLAGQLKEALAKTVSRGHQAMLFLNRRGYAPLVLCRACGHRFQCPQCSAWLVLHKSKPRIECHHCGYAEPAPKKCPQCQAEDTLQACGPGVERIAEEVEAFLPGARIGVMASDHTESYNELQQTIESMQRGGIDILIGTQMIAKGHHFAGLALVGIVDADMALGGGDPRAGERTYQLLHQLSGRAGREQVAGTVLIQTYAPEHAVMRALASGDRDAFLKLELATRKVSRMPPFARLAAIIVEGTQEDTASGVAREIARTAPRYQGLDVLGPAPAPLFRLRGKTRFRLLVRAERSLNLQQVLSAWILPMKLPNTVRVKLDIDPYGFL